jgi:drug/metabolite transporter (DMT)-like permease
MIYGLGSAFGFGMADLLGAISSRRIGVPVTLFIIQLVDVAALSALLLTPLPESLDASRAGWIAILASGALGTISFFCFYRSLQLGPVAIVGPVFASYASISVILSVVLIGERLSGLAMLGVVSTIGGVVLASVGRAPRAGGRRESWGGIPFALAATVTWGVAAYLIGRYAQETGWFLPVYGSRLVELAGVGGAIVLLSATGRRPRSPDTTDTAIAAGAGLADVTAVALFARGSEVGLVSIVSAVSATFPLVLVVAGVTLFRERPTSRQWIGVLATVAGLVLLGLAR